jgi:ATP-dependent DNA ligase
MARSRKALRRGDKHLASASAGARLASRAVRRWSSISPGLRLNEHLAYPGDVVFQHACKMGLEGIVSKRLGSRYVSGRTRDWLKFKNPEAPAVKREAQED